MDKTSLWLAEHQRNVYSQTGEDGIIEKILETLPENDKWCVEFGAWDGLHLTNTRYLVESKGYSAVFIEADKNKFLDLQRNYAYQEGVTASTEIHSKNPLQLHMDTEACLQAGHKTAPIRKKTS